MNYDVELKVKTLSHQIKQMNVNKQESKNAQRVC